MELGDLLTMLRKEKGLLQKDVAIYLNLTVATVSNYEKKVRMPDLETLVRLADLYDVSTDYLLQRTRCRTSIRTLGRRLSADFTVGDLIDTTLHLDRNSIRFLLECCDLLRQRGRINDMK
ncbi:MAG: helix-turn-helix domain-containing protein [Lachnospiraceae bacterium]|nr:helix-turn-helix domain-containing protein [Lachnospiraceae bacterium]